MTQNFSRDEYFKLLKYSQDLKRQGKSLYAASKNSYNKLFHYSVRVESHLYWESREQFLELLEKFLENEIDSIEFRSAFRKQVDSNGEILEMLESNLIILSPHEKSKKFGEFMCNIYECGELYSPDSEYIREDYEISEIEFQGLVKIDFLKVQEFLKS